MRCSSFAAGPNTSSPLASWYRGSSTHVEVDLALPSLVSHGTATSQRGLLLATTAITAGPAPSSTVTVLHLKLNTSSWSGSASLRCALTVGDHPPLTFPQAIFRFSDLVPCIGGGSSKSTSNLNGKVFDRSMASALSALRIPASEDRLSQTPRSMLLHERILVTSGATVLRLRPPHLLAGCCPSWPERPSETKIRSAYLSAMYAQTTMAGNIIKVNRPSVEVTSCGVHMSSTNNTQKYAKRANTLVTAKTAGCSIIRVCPGSSAQMQTAEMTKRLNAALPTIVDVPSLPISKPPKTTSITESKISGAEEPRAISVRFATVGFHTFTLSSMKVWLPPSSSGTRLTLSELVISSIAAMNALHTSPTPWKSHIRPRK
mmetsp:Transcript_61916/g.175832  ORF Transcript_61916/g.175832 Transcript_61916/m.175832 type:complete len:374 (-) Transcript_61916:1129-2250(-)